MIGFAATPPGRITGPGGKFPEKPLTIGGNARFPGSNIKAGLETMPLAPSTTSSWLIVDSPSQAGLASLKSVSCVSTADCWSVSNYYNGTGVRTLISHWNGSSWNVVSSPNVGFNSFLDGVTCVSTSDCWAVGNYDGNTLTLHWDGIMWSVAASPSPGVLYSVSCTSASNCWAVGTRGDANGNSHTLTIHWNGASWSFFSSPDVSLVSNLLYGVTCTSGSNCWAVGNSYNGASSDTLIEHWDGISWSHTNSPNASATRSNYLNSVACASASNCWTVGSYNLTVGSKTLIEKWDGVSWAIVISPNASIRQNDLYGVTCVSDSDCWSVGYAPQPNPPTQRTLIEHWNGNSWAIVTSSNTNNMRSNQLFAVTCASSSDCWAVGSFDNGGTYQSLIERWAPLAVPFVSADSRKTHGNSGPFRIDLPLTENPGIECRSAGPSNAYQVVISFAVPVTVTAANITAGSGDVSSMTVSGSEVTVDLVNILNAQIIAVTLSGVNDGTHSSSVNIPMRVLVGDTSANGSVNATDVTQTKARSGEAVTASNFREDVSVNGVISSTDIGIVKTASGTALP